MACVADEIDLCADMSKATIEPLTDPKDTGLIIADPDKIKQVMKIMKDEDKSNVDLDEKLSSLMGENVFVREIINQSTKAIADAEEELHVKCMLEDLGYGKEDSDPYGDGEQSQLFGAEAMKMQAQSAQRMDYDFEHNTRLSEWSKACYEGNKAAVIEFLNKATAISNTEVMHLIEKRESLMRVCGLFHIVFGVRKNPSKSHVEIAKLLIEKGARVNAKDVGGSTSLNHCMSQFGNPYSLEIARMLVANGADVNSTNRFGSTALFEPCITLNYEYIEFLVCHGCNPKHVDSFGVSCYAYASMNQKIASIFSKGNCRLAEKEKWILKLSGKENLVDACSNCGAKDKVLKKCSGCLVVGYCSTACQKNHWKAHKRPCKAKQTENKRNDMVLVFHPVTEPGKSEKPKRGKQLSDGKNVILCEEKAMRVKVQAVVGGQGARADRPLIVYDKQRSYQATILPSEENFKKLFDMIQDKGYGGIILYFTATLKKTSDLHVNISETHPETW